jgi:2'-hydroxyisoflavone reductase
MKREKREGDNMKLLILGGTKFLGRHLVDAGLAHGHSVTTFTRGTQDDVLQESVERLRGDRDGDLAALQVSNGRRWDAVCDTSGYVPRVVCAGAVLLSGAVGAYAFISSISVYRDFPAVTGIHEGSPVGTLPDLSVEEVTGETYGPLKALCEEEVSRAFPGRALVIRPGLIVGPYDPTNRFTYWPQRVAQGGEVLSPGRPDRSAQFIIDGRDLAVWTVRMLESSGTGTYNAAGPDWTLTMADVLQTARTVSGSDATFTWVSDAFLVEHSAGAWMEVPLWMPEAEGAGLATVNCQKAFQAGLKFRPLAETIRDTLAWRATQPASAEWPAGLASKREADLLAAWHAQTLKSSV